MRAESPAAERTVEGTVSCFGDAPAKPTFHAKDHRRDNWRPDVRPVTFHDARGWARPASLRREGATIAPHPTAMRGFADRDEVSRVYARELEELIAAVTGASKVIFRAYGNEPTWMPGVPHVAFADPGCPPDAGPRISVEARPYAVYDEWKDEGPS